MSESSIAIVPKIGNYPNRHAKAAEILDFLMSKDIVKAVKSDCILSDEYGYAVSDGARLISENPEYLYRNNTLNGLEIITEEHVFHAGSHGLEEVICPNCKANLIEDGIDIFDQDYSYLSCKTCNHKAEINQFTFEPCWAFSNLGFVFWNWQELSDEFIQTIEKMLACEVAIVYQRI